MAVWRNSRRGGGIANTSDRDGDRDHVPAQVSRLINVYLTVLSAQCNNNHYGCNCHEWL